MKKIMLAIGSSEIGGGQKVFLSYIKEFIKRDYSIVVFRFLKRNRIQALILFTIFMIIFYFAHL